MQALSTSVLTFYRRNIHAAENACADTANTHLTNTDSAYSHSVLNTWSDFTTNYLNETYFNETLNETLNTNLNKTLTGIDNNPISPILSQNESLSKLSISPTDIYSPKL